jgi:predicted HicB family RNase H-like nuclease
MGKSDLLIDAVPVRTRRALQQEARKGGISINDVVVGVLCTRYGLVCDPTAPRYYPGTNSRKLYLRLPAKVHRLLRIEAAENGWTQGGLVLKALAEHFELPVKPAKRRSKLPK